MISRKIFDIIKNSKDLKKFLINCSKIEIYFKRIENKEIKRIEKEYEKLFFNLSKDIVCITFIKNNLSKNNFQKNHKIKFYIDLIQNNIIKILKK